VAALVRVNERLIQLIQRRGVENQMMGQAATRLGAQVDALAVSDARQWGLWGAAQVKGGTQIQIVPSGN
jgi:hypothetical protein